MAAATCAKTATEVMEESDEEDKSIELMRDEFESDKLESEDFESEELAEEELKEEEVKSEELESDQDESEELELELLNSRFAIVIGILCSCFRSQYTS